MHGWKFNSLCYADDIGIFETDHAIPQQGVTQLADESTKYRLKINIQKTKGREDMTPAPTDQLMVEREEVDALVQFVYLDRKTINTW